MIGGERGLVSYYEKEKKQKNLIEKKNILSEKYNISDIFRYCSGEEKIIFYNLIENIKDNYLELYNYIITKKPNYILECGGGISTFVIPKALEKISTFCKSLN